MNFLLRPREILRPSIRRLTVLPHILFGVFAGVGPLVHPDRYGYLDGTFFAGWLPLQLWGIGFLIASLAGIHVVLTSSWKSYVTCNMGTLLISFAMLAALVHAEYLHQTVPALHRYGQWLFIISACIVLALIPTTVINTRPELEE